MVEVVRSYLCMLGHSCAKLAKYFPNLSKNRNDRKQYLSVEIFD